MPPPKSHVMTKMEELIHHFIVVTEGSRSAAGRNLFRGRKSQGRTWFLHQQQRRRRAASAENSRTLVCQSEHSAGTLAGLHDERCGGCARQSGLRYGRMRQIIILAMKRNSLRIFWPRVRVDPSVAGCDRNVSGSKLTPANYDQVTIGMSKEQVEKILGPPTIDGNQGHDHLQEDDGTGIIDMKTATILRSLHSRTTKSTAKTPIWAESRKPRVRSNE